MSYPLYALQWTNIETGETSLCEVESSVVYECGTKAAMASRAVDLNAQAREYRWAGQYRAVPLPFVGDAPEWANNGTVRAYDSPTDQLCREYAEWNLANCLGLGSADEHLFDPNLTVDQLDWLKDYCRRWDEAVEQERRDREPTISSELHIEEHYGTTTSIRTVTTRTLLDLRRYVRDHNGTIPIYSDYDCTGLICGMGCKMLKIYKTYAGYTAVLECSVTRDV